MVSAISSNFYLRESNSNRAVDKSEVLVASGDIKKLSSHRRSFLQNVFEGIEPVSIYKRVRNQ